MILLSELPHPVLKGSQGLLAKYLLSQCSIQTVRFSFKDGGINLPVLNNIE